MAWKASMASVLLIYPFFKPFPDLTIFRQPPLGLCYVAASLREAGHGVRILDCTFLGRQEALRRAVAAAARIVGIYSMVSMGEESLWFARELRKTGAFLVAGGPLPTCSPELFLQDFDLVVRGEGEETMKEVVRLHETGEDPRVVRGVASRTEAGVSFAPPRSLAKDLDSIPFPARDLLPNDRYIRFGKRKVGYSITTIMSSRGCPYACEFCSNVIFGGSFRERATGLVVDEIEQALALGYQRIAFADDVFTMNRGRVLKVCEEIGRRRLKFRWECLGRVDSLDYPTALEMRKAGCARIFFGIESGDDGVLRLMNKRTTAAEARAAVENVRRAQIKVGAFFILFYPGETDETVLKTLAFATSLPLNYLGLSMPYPLPGTALLERVRDRMVREWRPRESKLANHVLTFKADFSEAKIWLGILKGHAQFEMRRRLGPFGPPAVRIFGKATDALLKLMR